MGDAVLSLWTGLLQITAWLRCHYVPPIYMSKGKNPFHTQSPIANASRLFPNSRQLHGQIRKS